MFFIFVIITFLFGALIAYGKLPFIFFLQDEWLAFGSYIYWGKANLSWFERLFVFGQETHRIPLGNIVSYLEFYFFQLNFYPYGIIAILIHVANSFLVFYLANLLFRKKMLSFIAGLFFLFNSISHQAITWISTTIGTAGSTFFALLALIFFALFLVRGEKILNLILTILFLGISLSFKETSLFLFFFFPIMWVLFTKKRNYLNGLKASFPFLILGFFYTLLRAYLLFFNRAEANTSIISDNPSFQVYIYRLFTMPLKFIVESIIPQEWIINVASKLLFLAYPQYILSDGTPNPFIVESIASDIIIFVCFFIIFILALLAIIYFKKAKQVELIKILLLPFLYIGMSSLPFIMIQGRAGYTSLIDGRHLYLSGIFASILLGTIGIWFFSKYSKARFIIIGVVCLVFSFQILKIRGDIEKQVEIAGIRKETLNNIYKLYPSLPEKTIIYTESDKSYYGLPDDEKILPFQSGLGQTLLVWYNQHGEEFPACFFDSTKFLYEITSEGYRECEGKGFGYFRKMKDLKEAIQAYNFPIENIIAFKFSSSDNSTVDITATLRKDLGR